jgi:hypothetical protein
MDHAPAASEVREALSALGRAIKRAAMYRHARERHASCLQPAVAPLQALLARHPVVTLGVLPSALTCGGEAVYGEPAREGSLCFRLHRDGVRELTFVAGLDLDELVAFVDAALPDQSGPTSRDDAVTELWKADLRFVRVAAVSGYRMGDEGGESTIAAASDRAQRSLDPHTPDDAEEQVARDAPPLLTPEQLRELDPQDWGSLAARAASTVLRIVERGAAGRDVASLEEMLGKLLDEMIARGALARIADVLESVRRLGGPQAEDLRAAFGSRLSEEARLAPGLALLERYPEHLERVLPVWLELLPPASGDRLVDVLEERAQQRSAPLLARAVAERLGACRRRLEQSLRSGPEPAVRALLHAVERAAEPVRASLAAHALSHRSPGVRLAAVPLVAADAPVSLQHLAPLLDDGDATLRLAAAEALGGCAAHEDAAAVLVRALQRSEAAQAPRQEQIALHRALGRLGSDAGFRFLQGRLAGARRKLFGKRDDEEGLLAVQGLVADCSVRAVEALARAADDCELLRVAAASRAAVRLRRSRQRDAA